MRKPPPCAPALCPRHRLAAEMLPFPPVLHCRRCRLSLLCYTSEVTTCALQPVPCVSTACLRVYGHRMALITSESDVGPQVRSAPDPPARRGAAWRGAAWRGAAGGSNGRGGRGRQRGPAVARSASEAPPFALRGPAAFAGWTAPVPCVPLDTPAAWAGHLFWSQSKTSATKEVACRQV